MLDWQGLNSKSPRWNIGKGKIVMRQKCDRLIGWCLEENFAKDAVGTESILVHEKFVKGEAQRSKCSTSHLRYLPVWVVQIICEIIDVHLGRDTIPLALADLPRQTKYTVCFTLIAAVLIFNLLPERASNLSIASGTPAQETCFPHLQRHQHRHWMRRRVVGYRPFEPVPWKLPPPVLHILWELLGSRLLPFPFWSPVSHSRHRNRINCQHKPCRIRPSCCIMCP